MTSKKSELSAFVWIWLPESTEPVIAGKLSYEDNNIVFNYAKSFLEGKNFAEPAISLYEPELPLIAGIQYPLQGLSIAGCIRDASPDAWGRRVILNKVLSLKGPNADPDLMDEFTYLLESGSDRIGALDFQKSAFEYVPRVANNVILEELQESALRVEKGTPLTAALDQALFRGSSIGGARPKASIEDQNKKYIAKFSSSNDLYSIVKAEFIAMKLAHLVGLNSAPVQLVEASKKDVLLIERFDRVKTKQGWRRKTLISALTLFELDEMMARYASYETLAEIIRHRFTNPQKTLEELFARLVFNIYCGNTDDHARNHAAFWDGKELTLTPAYDICPQARSGNEASQAMFITNDNNLSQLKSCMGAAHHFLLSDERAREIIDFQREIIEKHWDDVCEEAKLSPIDKKLLWGRQFLNPFSLIL